MNMQGAAHRSSNSTSTWLLHMQLYLTIEVSVFSGLEIREYGEWIRHADHMARNATQKLALTSPTGDGCSVGIVRSRTQPTELLT
jgi:hypothetical protein